MIPPHRHVIINGPIDAACVDHLRRQIALLQWRSDEPIALIMSSYGGCVEAGCEGFEAIERARQKTRIVGYAKDMCQSAAVLLLVACDERHCSPHMRFVFEHRNASCLPCETDGSDAHVSLALWRRQRRWRRYVETFAKGMKVEAQAVEFLFNTSGKLSAQRALKEGLITSIAPLDQRLAA